MKFGSTAKLGPPIVTADAAPASRRKKDGEPDVVVNQTYSLVRFDMRPS